MNEHELKISNIIYKLTLTWIKKLYKKKKLIIAHS